MELLKPNKWIVAILIIVEILMFYIVYRSITQFGSPVVPGIVGIIFLIILIYLIIILIIFIISKIKGKSS